MRIVNSLWVVVFMALFIGGLTCADLAAAAAEPYNLGVALGLYGHRHALQQGPDSKGIQLAVEEINANGGFSRQTSPSRCSSATPRPSPTSGSER